MLLIQNIGAQEQLGSGRVIVDPNFVGAQSADIEFAFYSPINVPSGSVVTVTVPPEASLHEDEDITCRLQGIFTVSSRCASNGAREVTFVLPPGFTIIEKSFNSLIFGGAFFSPLSTRPTQPFGVKITDPDGTLILTDAGDLILNDLVAAAIQSSSTTQVNSVIVSKPTAIFVSLTTLNPIPTTGGVQLRLPKWNQMAADGVKQSYIVDESTLRAEIGNFEPL